MSKPGSKNTVRFRISDNFMQFWFRFIERNRSMIELDNYDDLREVVMRDYPVYSGLTLEKYFRQKLTEDGAKWAHGGRQRQGKKPMRLTS